MVVQRRGADEDPKETKIAASAEGEVNMNTVLNTKSAVMASGKTGEKLNTLRILLFCVSKALEAVYKHFHCP